MEQVRTAITGSLQFFLRAVPGNVMGGSILSNRILGCAEAGRQHRDDRGRDRHEGGDRQRENPDEGRLIVLTAD